MSIVEIELCHVLNCLKKSLRHVNNSVTKHTTRKQRKLSKNATRTAKKAYLHIYGARNASKKLESPAIPNVA